MKTKESGKETQNLSRSGNCHCESPCEERHLINGRVATRVGSSQFPRDSTVYTTTAIKL